MTAQEFIAHVRRLLRKRFPNMAIEGEKLTASRELDALVAEKVMGLTVYRNELGEPFLDDGSRPRHYSTDIADAWEVAEVVREKFTHDRFLVSKERIDWHGGIYCCLFDNGEADIASDWWARGDSPPLAICLAALRAVGV